MRSAFKEDLNATAADLLYGESLRLPGELLVPSPASGRYEDPADFVVQLRHKMSTIRPLPATRHGETSSFIFKDLATVTHVFLRDDTVRRALQPPYTGPFKVLERSCDGKTFTLNVKGRNVVVSVDRLKPAFIDHSGHLPTPADQLPVQSTPPPQPAVQGELLPVPLIPQQPVQDKLLEKQPYTTRSGRRVKFKHFD